MGEDYDEIVQRKGKSKVFRHKKPLKLVHLDRNINSLLRTCSVFYNNLWFREAGTPQPHQPHTQCQITFSFWLLPLSLLAS